LLGGGGGASGSRLIEASSRERLRLMVGADCCDAANGFGAVDAPKDAVGSGCC
jgi:hypothetical protein